MENKFWSEEIELQASLLQIVEDEVDCEVIIDLENEIFEERVFPKSIFENLTLVELKYFVISIKSCPGKMELEIITDPEKVKPEIWLELHKKHEARFKQLAEQLKDTLKPFEYNPK